MLLRVQIFFGGAFGVAFKPPTRAFAIGPASVVEGN